MGVFEARKAFRDPWELKQGGLMLANAGWLIFGPFLSSVSFLVRLIGYVAE
tara:strand:- start:11 stop:163 length:153 start_codon:yes stop_codon:yes gene_type:complete